MAHVCACMRSVCAIVCEQWCIVRSEFFFKGKLCTRMESLKANLVPVKNFSKYHSCINALALTAVPVLRKDPAEHVKLEERRPRYESFR